MFYASINSNSNVLYIPSRFLAFDIPLIFALQQLKTSKICTLFQPVKLLMSCILTITPIKWLKNNKVIVNPSRFQAFIIDQNDRCYTDEILKIGDNILIDCFSIKLLDI